MRAKRCSAGFLAGALAAILGGGPCPALAGPLACGDRISVDTRLTADLTDCPDVGLEIGASGVTLDLNGHTIDGDGDPDGNFFGDIGVLSRGHRNVTIRGGLVREFVRGVSVEDARAGARILDMTFRDSGFGAIRVRNSTGVRIAGTDARVQSSGIELEAVDRGVVVHNTITSSSGAAIADRGGTQNRIERNILRDNVSGIGLAGERGRADRNLLIDTEFAIGVVGVGNVVSRNAVLGAADGIELFEAEGARVVQNVLTDIVGCEEGCSGIAIHVRSGSGNSISHNRVDRTALNNGIQVDAVVEGPPGAPNTVSANVVSHAANDGIHVHIEPVLPVSRTVLTRNIVTAAADDGIDVRAASTTLARNLARRNGDRGIDAVAGVIDGGGNTAFRNGNPVQCINVMCAP